MKKSTILIFAFLFCSALLVCGCSGFPKRDRQGMSPEFLEPQVALKFADLPVPAKFKIMPQDSYSFESSGIRVGLLKYRGKANIDQAVNFYKDQMPIYNWNLVNAVEYGQRILNFEREAESCIVTLLSKGSTVFITVSLGPKAQVRSKKSDKPVK